MKVFLDSNVLVSGIVFHGNEHELLKASLEPRHRFAVSEDVLREVRAVLSAKFPGLEGEGETFLRLLPLEIVRRDAYADRKLPPSLRIDAADAHVVLAALACGADILATGDRGILAASAVGNMEILRPRDALRRVRSAPR